jgi:hypothetical protein
LGLNSQKPVCFPLESWLNILTIIDHICTPGDAVVSLRAMSGGFVLMGTIEGALMSWSLPTNRRVQRLALLDRKNDKNACLSCMDVSQGDANAQTHLVAAGLSSGRVILADSRTGDRVQVWDDFTQRVSALAMPAFSQQLFASAYDGVFQVRNLEANVVQHQYCACQCPITSMQPVASAVHEVCTFLSFPILFSHLLSMYSHLTGYHGHIKRSHSCVGSACPASCSRMVGE